MNYRAYKQDSMVMKPHHHELDRVPRQVSDFMNEQCNRFSEICKIYLEGMTIDDLCFMRPEDFINLVPDDQYRHKLLMTIMVRRYLFRPDGLELGRDHDIYTNIMRDNENREYPCDKCSHKCLTPNCSHNCNEYAKIVTK